MREAAASSPLSVVRRRRFSYRQLLLVFVPLLVISCGQGASDADKDKKSDADASGVTLTPDQVKSLGIATMPVQAAAWVRQVTGYGTVVALDTIAQSDADYLTAAAAAQQSEAAANRARSLSTGEEAAVSREVVEAAQSKASADAAALALARRKADSAFGIHAPWHSEAERSQLMSELSSGKTVLVRVTFPLGALPGITPGKISISRLGGAGQSWASGRVWEAPADPNLPGRGFFVLVSGSDLAQNEHVFASVAVGQPQAGAVVPASSLLLSEGEASVYLETSPGHFQRSRIGTDKPMGEGYFIGPDAGIAPGRQVVTSGAGILMAREVNPSSAGAD